MNDNDKWIQLWKIAVKIWVEDDACTPSCGIESVYLDLWRAMRISRPYKPTLEIDLGDCILSVYDKGYLIIFETNSYPSFNSFAVANEYLKREIGKLK